MTNQPDSTPFISTRLAGKVALVAGGTSGIGLAIARKLAASGAIVVVNGRARERAERAVEELRAFSPSAEFVLGDCGDYASAAEIVRYAASKGDGALDILVSAGAEGGVGPKLFHEMTPDEIEASFSKRVFPRVFAVHAAISSLRKAANGGCVLMVTTDAARHVTPGEAIIGATGAALVLLTKALAREFSRWNIRVNALSLTLTSETPSWDRIFSAQTFENDLFTKALSRFPSGRAPTAEEVARAAHFLVSEEAAQITGQTVSVNGGLSFGGW